MNFLLARPLYNFFIPATWKGLKLFAFYISPTNTFYISPTNTFYISPTNTFYISTTNVACAMIKKLKSGQLAKGIVKNSGTFKENERNWIQTQCFLLLLLESNEQMCERYCRAGWKSCESLVVSDLNFKMLGFPLWNWNSAATLGFLGWKIQCNHCEKLFNGWSTF